MADIHPRLIEDCFLIGKLPLSHVLLMNDAQYPWIILVPDRDDISEIWQLSEADQAQLARESAALGEYMARRLSADKMNVAALGNVVPQLHVHHIARFRDDAAWPKPVWGVHGTQPYSASSLADLRAALGIEGLDGFEAV